MTEYMMEPEPERDVPYRDVGRMLPSTDNSRWEWAVRECNRLAGIIERGGEVNDEELIQRFGMPDYAEPFTRGMFSASDRPQIFYTELAPILSTSPDIEWLNAWGLTDDAPEPDTDEFREAASELSIPRGQRSLEFGTFSTERYAAFIRHIYGYHYTLDREHGTKVSTFELYHRFQNFGFDPDHLAEAMGYYSQLEGVVEPEGRDEYTLSPLAVHDEPYELSTGETAFAPDEEIKQLKQLAQEEPPAWRHVETTESQEEAAEAEVSA